jgi:CheY-like chemotaxis protein
MHTTYNRETTRWRRKGELSQGHAPSPDHLRDLRVLVVDEEPDARELFSLRFTSYEAELRDCASAAETFRTLDKWRTNMLVSDIGMPGEDGYELLRKIRAREPERGGPGPAVALTAHTSGPRMRGGRSRQATRYTFPKPVDSDLLAAVEMMLPRIIELKPKNRQELEEGKASTLAIGNRCLAFHIISSVTGCSTARWRNPMRRRRMAFGCYWSLNNSVSVFNKRSAV